MNPSPLSPRFLAQLAHDLRSPLNVVTSTLGDLAREPTELDAKDRTLMLSLSQRAVGRLVGMSDRLGMASRVGNGLAATLVPMDLVALTQKTLADFTAELRKRIEVVTEFSKEPVMVRADPALLPMLLRELLSNANRYARRSFRVEVFAGPQPGVAVDDDGEGIPVDERSKMFEPFAERNSRTGLGMGLWLAKSLAEVQSGSMTIEHGTPGTRQILKLGPPA